MKNIPELLIPAGGMEQLKAAIASGADAVYLGGSSFSARARADNFSRDALKEAIQYAHNFGVKVHVALNTLLTDDEIPAALEFAAEIYSEGADAVIVQDTGLFTLIHRCIPKLCLHLSTQGTVTDFNGVRAAAERGAERVILARELSLEEIRGICQLKGNIEIEIFVHGAICISLSGQCHMSGMIGTRSGNRGDCAQPCRMKYSLLQKEKGTVSEGYQISPKDMCLLTHLEQIAEAGVDSIKIEGRMKSSEYVAAVTGIYRKHLDLIRNGETEAAEQCAQEDLKVLRQMYSRGTFTDVYFNGSAYADLMSGLSPKHQGVPIGKTRTFHQKTGHAAVRLSDHLSVGDGVEIRGIKGTADNVVTYLRDTKGRMLREAESGSIVEIGDLRVKGGIPEKGSLVYKLTDKGLIRKMRKQFDRIPQRIPVRFRLSAVTGAPLFLEGETEENGVIFRSEAKSMKNLEQAHSSMTDRDTIKEKLSKTGGTPYFCEEAKISLEGNPFVQVSVLNELRRQVLADLTGKRLRSSQPSEKDAAEAVQECQRALSSSFIYSSHMPCTYRNSMKTHYLLEEWYEKGIETVPDERNPDSSQNKGHWVQLFFYKTSDLEKRVRDFLTKLGSSNIRTDRLILCLPVDVFARLNEKADLQSLINQSGCPVDVVLPVEMRNTGVTEEQIETLLRKVKNWRSFRAVMIADPGQQFLANQAEVPFETDRHLNVLNSRTAGYWLSEGALSVCLTEEPEAFRSFNFHAVSNGVFVDVYGRIPVMYLEHCPIGSHKLDVWHSGSDNGKASCCDIRKKYYYCRQGEWMLRDRTGALYPVEADSRSCRAVVYSHREIDYSSEKTHLISCGVRMFRINSYDESPEKLMQVLKQWM